MGTSAKLVPFFQKIDGGILFEWKETITQNETIKGRLENALKRDIEENKKKND